MRPEHHRTANASCSTALEHLVPFLEDLQGNIIKVSSKDLSSATVEWNTITVSIRDRSYPILPSLFFHLHLLDT
ncbi:hypothetical protein A0H81_06817 [Grifola frondosa]|uniref:Uncharacterized protein n=1 Tax=Grifola frondosa TaxID=5627 RepID=A0A1C7M8U2_GRIFR|nr:hypothetical protein A0H81_06817 [Grifola frondosa]